MVNFPEEDGVEFSTKEEGGEGSDERDRFLSIEDERLDILFSATAPATAQTAMNLHSVSEGNV